MKHEILVYTVVLYLLNKTHFYYKIKIMLLVILSIVHDVFIFQIT